MVTFNKFCAIKSYNPMNPKVLKTMQEVYKAINVL